MSVAGCCSSCLRMARLFQASQRPVRGVAGGGVVSGRGVCQSRGAVRLASTWRACFTPRSALYGAWPGAGLLAGGACVSRGVLFVLPLHGAPVSRLAAPCTGRGRGRGC